MPRTKLVMKLIESEKKRKATYKNRRDGLEQKVSQLVTLCGIDAALICFGPAVAGGEVTTWPADRRAVLDLIARYRSLPPEKIRQNENTPSLLRGDLSKQQRALLKVQHGAAEDVLTPWDCRLDELSVDGLDALYDKLTETLRRTQQRLAELGGGHAHAHDDALSAALAITAPGPLAAASPADNALDFLSFGWSNAGLIGAHHYHPSLHDILLQQQVPMQPPFLAFDMPPAPPPAPRLAYHMLPPQQPSFAYQMPPAPPLPTSLDFGMRGADFKEQYSHPYAGNVDVHGGAAAPRYSGEGFPADLRYECDYPGQSFAASLGYHGDVYLDHGFASDAGAVYDPEPSVAADTWPASCMVSSNPADGGAFQQQSDLKGLHGGSSSSSSLQGWRQN